MIQNNNPLNNPNYTPFTSDSNKNDKTVLEKVVFGITIVVIMFGGAMLFNYLDSDF